MRHVDERDATILWGGRVGNVQRFAVPFSHALQSLRTDALVLYQILLYRLCPTFRQPKVALGGATRIGVAFDDKAEAGELPRVKRLAHDVQLVPCVRSEYR